MRNLKRVLSLALAALMLMGMMVVGAGAASKDFTDGSEIKNVEAVDVMVALGVLQGGDKGDFQPNSILTREQAAKIICYMLLGPENAEKLATSGAVFSDVAADRWSAPYIAYCVNLGILAGDGNGNFFPEGKLTGAAFAKMLLVALGYDATIEQYVGNSWTINVATAALDTGILPDGLVLTNELSRQDAAQMAFNTLTADMVSYSNKGTTITVGGVEISQGASKAEAVKNTKTDYTTSNGQATESSDGVMQFCEKYFSKLLVNKDGKDNFGRTATIWTYDKKDVGTYAAAADLTYTGTVKASDIYKDLGKVEVTNVKVSSNGATPSVSNKKITANSTDTFGAISRTVEVFYDKDTKTATLYAIDYVLGEVTKVNAAKYDKDGDVTTEANIEITYNDSSKVTYETAAFEKGDMVLFTQNNNATENKGVQSVQLAKTVEGKVTAVKGDEVTIDGTAYTAKAGVVKLGSDGTFYLGVDGAIVGFDGVVTSDDYLYIYKVDRQDGGLNSDGIAVGDSYIAYTVAADGTKASYTVDSKLVGSDEGDLFTTSNYSTYTGVICYKINSDGELTTSGAATTGVTKKASVTFGKDHAVVSDKYSSAETTFVFATEKDKAMDVKVVTGYKNVAEQTANAWIVYNKETDKIVTVFVAAAPEAATEKNSDVYTLLDTEPTVTLNSEDENVYTYSVQLNGKTTTLEAKDEVFSGKTAGYLFTVTLTDGVIAKAGDVKDVTTVSGKVTKIVDDYIVIDGTTTYTIDTDAEFYLVEKDGSAVTLTGTTLAVDDQITFYVVGGSGDNKDFVAGGLVTRK